MADLVEAQFTRQRKTLAEAMAAGGAMQLQPTQHCMTSDDDALIYRGTESFGSVFRRTLSYPISLTTDLVGQIPIMGANKSIVFSTGTRSAGKFLAYDGTWQTPAGGGGSTTTLQGAYDNSIEPEIVTNNTLGALSLANGQTLDTANQLEVKRLAGDITASIDGNGEIRVKNYNEEGTYPLMTAKVGIDPFYNPYIYFGADLGTTTRRGMSIGNGALSISSDEIADLTIAKKVSNGKNSTIHMAQDEKIYHSTQLDTLSWAGDGRHNFWNSVGVTSAGGAGNTDILIDPATGVNLKSGLLYKINGVQHVHENGIAYTGFNDPDLVTSSTYDPVTRKITLVGTAILYYEGKVVFDLNVAPYVSSARPVGDGLWFHYYNGTSYVWTTTAWLFKEGMLGQVYKLGATEFGIVEHHGCMQAEVHRRLHETLGTSKISGGVSSGIVPGQITPSQRRPAYTASVLRDEDLTTTIESSIAGVYTTMDIAALNTTNFRTSADIVYMSGGIPAVNDPTTGAMTALSTNQYMNIFVVDVPTMSDDGSRAYRRWFVNGQLASTTRATIEGQLPSSLILGNISADSQEFVFTYRIMIRYTSGGWSVISETKILGTKVSQVTTPVLGSVALPSLVTGGLGLIPVGTTALGHTVYDGSAGTQLSFDGTYGLLSSNSGFESFTAFRPVWDAGATSQNGIAFSMVDSGSGYTHKSIYAGAYGEIVSNGTSPSASIDGAFIGKAMTAGTLTEQFRAVGGKLGVGRTPTAYKIEASSIGAIGDGVTVAQLVANSPIGATTLGASVVTSNNVNAVTMASWGSLVVEDTLFGVSKRSRNDLMAEGGILALGTKTAHNIVIGTNNLPAVTIGTNQNSTFTGKIIAPSTTAFAGINIGTTSTPTPTSSVAGDLWMPNSTGLRYKSVSENIYDLAATTLANNFTLNQTFSAIRGILLTGAGSTLTTAGDWAHDITQKAFTGFANGIKGWIPRTLASVYGAVTVTNNAGTVCFAGSKAGSNVLAASAMALVGKRYQVKVTGYLNFTVSSPFYATGWLGTTGGGSNIGASTLTIAPTGGNVPFSAVMDVVTTAHSTTSTLNTHIVLKVGGVSAQSSTSTASIATTSVPMEILINQDVVSGNSFTITGAYLQELI